MTQFPDHRTARRRGLSAPLALPAGFGALLVVGAAAAASHGAVSGRWVLILAALIVGIGSAVAEPVVAPVLGAIGWLTIAGFSRAPYAELQPTARLAGVAALAVGASMICGIVSGVVVRRVAESFTLWIVEIPGEPRPGEPFEAAEARLEPLAATAGPPRTARPGSRAGSLI